jgi:phosphoglycerate dehydrogenase-like enzyme
MRILFCGSYFPAAAEFLRQRLPAEAGDELRIWSDGELVEHLDGVDIVIPAMHRIDAGVMDAGHFRLIQQWGSGLEGVDLEAARARGIWVANVPSAGGNSESVAEHAVLLMLSLLRKLPEAQANVRSGELGAPLGRMLRGRTVCLCGLGSIALALAGLLRPFGVRLLGLTRDPSLPKVASLGLDRCYSYDQREPCLAQTDILVLCVRLSYETRNLIGAHELACLPAGACLVNIARGGLVEYHALYAALASGHLAGAGLDVYWQEPIPVDDPILALPTVIATPHIAGVTDRSYGEIADALIANFDLFRRGEPPCHRAL